MNARVGFAAAVIAVLAGGALGAQDSGGGAEQPVEKHGQWTLRVEPVVWFTGPSGTLKLPGSASGVGGSSAGDGGTVGALSLQGGAAQDVDLRDLDIDTPEASPAIEINLGRGDWRFGLRAIDFSGDQQAAANAGGSYGSLAYAAGDEVSTSLDYSQFELEVGYSLRKRDLSPYPQGFKFHSNFELIAGLRVYDFEWSVENTTAGGALGTEETFWEPIVGAKISMELYEQFDIDLQLTAGGLPLGDDSSYSLDVIVGGAWRPVENVGVLVGYRLTGYDLSSGSGDEEFEWQGSMAGLYAGLVLQF
ncbi:MAG: hypothetical protein ACOYN0_04015 [Phycisphaerales bacterium]